MQTRWRGGRSSGGLVAVLVVVATVLGVPAASASCAMDERSLDEQLADATVAFVGQVRDVRHDTTALISVEEVWIGQVPEEVTVFGGPDDPGMATSVDRTWQLGTTYLVVPRVVDGDLHDDSCSPTRAWTEDLEGFRPAAVTAPTAVPDSEGTDGRVVALALIVLGLAVAATAWGVRDHRRG